MYFLAQGPGSPFPTRTRDNMSPSDSIFKVVQKQLGLRLDRTSSKLRVMFVQHIETSPGEN
jgi:uncharacterized protein (TIGR03435 family)